MSIRYTQSFKMQAVEKALNRTDGVSQDEVAETLGVGKATLNKWITQSRKNEFEPNDSGERLPASDKNKEKRPQDWCQEERFNIIMACHSLDEKSTSDYCRTRGIYLHHLKQWKQDFMNGATDNKATKRHAEIKNLKAENTALKKELTRKEKALAEAAALLILKKKVHEIWENDEESSR